MSELKRNNKQPGLRIEGQITVNSFSYCYRKIAAIFQRRRNKKLGNLAPEENKTCTYCNETVGYQATECPFCGSMLEDK